MFFFFHVQTLLKVNQIYVQFGSVPKRITYKIIFIVESGAQGAQNYNLL